MSKNIFLATISAIVCFSSVFLNAQTDPNNWEKLNLSSTTIAGTKVYYEKSFEPNLPFFEKKYREILARQKETKILDSKKDQILADINNILGIKEPPIENQEKLWSGYLNLMPSLENMTFYLVKQSTTKDFLRAGGKLPNFTYNKENDTAEYNPMFENSSQNPQTNLSEFAFPIDFVENFENIVNAIFKIFQKDLGQIMEGTLIHEITEITLLSYLRQTDQYWRWFTDGFSEAITYELLKKHFNISRAEEYLSNRNPDQFSEYEKEINLRYWMSGQFCLLTAGLPTRQGADFTLARYAYATFEARRLIDKYGIECVRKILDAITKKESRAGSDLLETIKNVTGEDMNARLAEYQTFEKREEGIEKYAKAFNEASDKKDLEQMAFNLFRMHDFRLLSDFIPLMDDFRYASTLLFKLGYQKEADSVINNCLTFFSNPGYKNGKLASYEVLIYYALETGKPLAAREAADELLKAAPDNIGALTIKMYEHLEKKQLDQAKEIAQKIIDGSQSKDTRNYKVASQVLAIDPNQLSAK